jgi:N-acetylglucosamine-6-phosphate deacetylase
MKCNGYSLSTREFVDVEFDAVIQNVDPLLNATGDEKVLLVPGLVDLQVNGFAGADYNSATTPHEEIARSLRAIFSTGVTRFFPTVITAAPEAMLGALRNLASAKESLPDGEAMEGFHVEGPHISPEDGPRGVHLARWVRPPDLDEFSRWQEAAQGNIRLVTLSPEWPGSTDYIERLSVQGVATTIGHSRATGDQIRDAVRAGATLSTHLGNAAYAVPLREGNLWDQLAEDRLAASFIADGIHLSDMFLRVALRAKGVERSILITDAVAPSMCPPGPYRVGDIEVELKEDGRVVLRGGDRLPASVSPKPSRWRRSTPPVSVVCGLANEVWLPASGPT